MVFANKKSSNAIFSRSNQWMARKFEGKIKVWEIEHGEKIWTDQKNSQESWERYDLPGMQNAKKENEQKYVLK